MFRIIKSSDLTTSSKLALRDDISGNWSLYYFSMTNHLYNVTSENNVVYGDLGGAFSFSIPPGSYSYVDLTSQLQTQLNVVDPGNFTVTYSLITGKYTVTNSTNNWYWTFGTNTTSSAYKLLGSLATDSTSALAWTSDVTADLISRPVFFIEFREDVDRRFVDSDHLTASFMISSDSLFQEAIRVDNMNSPTQDITFKLTKNLTVHFLDLSGNALDFSNHDWFLVLKKKV